jgi:endonuclease/exonuclease/phosphatase (EEP) superfamily protein YafD
MQTYLKALSRYPRWLSSYGHVVLWQWLRGVVLVLGLGAAIATFGNFGFRLWWGLLLLEHFRLQYSQVLMVAIALSLTLTKPQRNRFAGFFALPLLFNLYLTAPQYIPQPSLANLAPHHLKVLYATLDNQNPDSQEAVATLTNTGADLIMALEVTPENMAGLGPALASDYELIRSNPESWSSNGMALWKAKSLGDLVVDDSTYIHIPKNNLRPLLKATFRYAGQVIDIICLHAARPQNRYALLYQQMELERFDQWSLANPNEMIVVGDINSTPWSRSVRRILRSGKLLNSQAGFGLQLSWNAFFPKFLQIPIDHCFHSKAFRTVDRQILGSTGSDHLPILIELEVQQKA